MIIAYARVSTDGQSTAAQIEALNANRADMIFAENISGGASNRKELSKAIAALKEGDTLLVTRLDRLARNTRDLLNILAAISEKGATFKSLNDPWADTTTPTGRLILAVLGGLAEFERELIKSRTADGRARAAERGVPMGRPPKLTRHQRAAALEMLDEGTAQTEVARLFNVSPASICVMAKNARVREGLAL